MHIVTDSVKIKVQLSPSVLLIVIYIHLAKVFKWVVYKE